jgi:putative mRNA 3-end processing factor
MIEATYGDPAFRFPEPFDVYEDISKWMREKTKDSNVIIGAYRMGKSQEVIRILNEYLGIAPIVGSSIFGVAKTYNELGHKLDALEIGSDEAQDSLQSGFVAILPPNKVNAAFARALSAAHGRPCLSVSVTGWSLRYGMNVDQSFPLSDHSDYYDAVKYMDESGAKKVTFFDGETGYLAKAAKSLGIEVVS